MGWFSDLLGSAAKTLSSVTEYQEPTLTEAQKLAQKFASNLDYYGAVGNSNYAAHLNINGVDYAFLPKDLVQKGGFQAPGKQYRTNLLGEPTYATSTDAYVFPWLLDKNNLDTISKNATAIDFTGSTAADTLTKGGLGLSGYLVKYDAVPFDSVAPRQIPDRNLNGLKNVDGQIVAGLAGGHGNSYYNPSDTLVHDPYVEGGSFLGVDAGTINAITPVALAFVAPQLGAALATELGVSTAAGTAVASTALQVAAGVDPSKALENAVTNAVVQTGSAGIAKEINGALSGMDATTAAGLSNAAGSALASAATTAARGGSQQDIIDSAIAGAAGSAATTTTGEAAVGGAVTGALTGGTQGALVGAAGALGRQAGTTEAKAAEQKTAYQTLQDSIAAADLTTEEKASVQRAIQDVYTGASTAQALPATTTDAVGTAAGRLGSPFASNDPDFYRALVKNPALLRSFSEYSNTYGYSGAGDASFVKLLADTYSTLPPNSQYAQDLKAALEDVLTKNPNLATDQTKEIVSPTLSPVVSQEISSEKVTPVTVPEYQPEITAPTTAPVTTPETAPSTYPGISPASIPGVLPDIVPGIVPAGMTGVTPSTAPEAATETRLATQPSFAEKPPTGGGMRAPSFYIPPAKKTQFPTAGETAPSYTGDVSETPAETPSEVPVEDRTGKPVDQTGSYKPSLTTARSVTGASVTGPTSTLARALQGDFYPTSTTGLTAYRPAGEIESEETGKKRQDVWNEASLRLKDALGI